LEREEADVEEIEKADPGYMASLKQSLEEQR
jgi:hypothetical protein